MEPKTQRQLPEVLPLPPFFFFFSFLDPWSHLPFFTANLSFILVSVCYGCISLIPNKSGCWMLEEYLQCAKEHFICSISFTLPKRQWHCFITTNTHLNHYLHCIATIYHVFKCLNVGKWNCFQYYKIRRISNNIYVFIMCYNKHYIYTYIYHSFIHSFNKHLLSASYVPGIRTMKTNEEILFLGFKELTVHWKMLSK